MTTLSNAPHSVKIAIMYPLGLLPAPGTWGSLPGLLLGAFLSKIRHELGLIWLLDVLFLALIFAFICYFSLKIIDSAEGFLNCHDDKRIVLDEVIGQAIPVSFITIEPVSMLICFGLFRFFDILKPGPIGVVDKKWPGAYGTLFDDVIAGIIALIVFLVGNYLWRLLSM